MNTNTIRLAADKLDTARKRLDDLRNERTLLNCGGHQSEISVSVGGVRRVVVAYQSCQTGYTTKLIRGREMIMLGVIKAFDGWIQNAEREVHEAETALASVLSTQEQP